MICSAGGRSRSPAVAISYLMIKDKLSYESAAGHVKALRPVISLNAGFETQLKCLERANCNFFDAHQLHLQTKLCALAQQRLDGTLEMALQKKRRQNHHSHQQQQQQHSAIPRTPPHPSPSIRSQQHQQREQQAAMRCCDDRGMLDGNLPSGFCLSLPFTSKKKTQFIPALRSMGSRFGCKSCGEHLFCASAVVQHSPTFNFNHSIEAVAHSSISPGHRREKQDGDDGSFDEPLAGDTCDDDIVTTPDAEIGVKIKPIETSQPPPAPKEADVKKKKPLLAKLRLRPQSPSVSSPTGSAKSTPRANGSVAVASVDSPAAALESAGVPDRVLRADDLVDVRGGVLKTLKKEKAKKHDTKDGCGLKHSPTGTSGTNSTNTSTTNLNKGADKLWRTLTAFTASKRMFKDAKDKKMKQHLPADLAAADDEKKRVKAVAIDGDEHYDHLPHELFLRENAATWKRSICTIERASDEDDEECSETRAQVTALLAADAKAMAMLDCGEWFIEPQAWFMDSLVKSHSGAIRCPNGDCNAIVGQWRWDGLRYEHGY